MELIHHESELRYLPKRLQEASFPQVTEEVEGVSYLETTSKYHPMPLFFSLP